MSTFPPVLDLRDSCYWMRRVANSLVNNHPAVKGHILDANQKRDFWNGPVSGLMRGHWASTFDEGGATWPEFDTTGGERRAGLLSCCWLQSPCSSFSCARAVNRYQAYQANSLYIYIHIYVYINTCVFKFAGEKREKQNKMEKCHSCFCCISIFIKRWLKSVSK